MCALRAFLRPAAPRVIKNDDALAKKTGFGQTVMTRGGVEYYAFTFGTHCSPHTLPTHTHPRRTPMATVPTLEELALASINEQQVEDDNSWHRVVRARLDKRVRDRAALDKEIEFFEAALKHKKMLKRCAEDEISSLCSCEMIFYAKAEFEEGSFTSADLSKLEKRPRESE